jgi:RNA polymerase-interacting CarD/CdnL/TRCF family regulator
MTKAMTDNTFKVGDKIVRFSRIWQVSKIEEQPGTGEEKEKILFYKPFFPINESSQLSLSIPVSNIKTVGIRRPVSKVDANSLLKTLNQETAIKSPIDLTEIKEKLESGIFATTVEALKKLWWSKKADAVTFTKSQQEVLDLAVKILTEEIACIYQLSPLGARKKITNILN